MSEPKHSEEEYQPQLQLVEKEKKKDVTWQELDIKCDEALLRISRKRLKHS